MPEGKRRLKEGNSVKVLDQRQGCFPAGVFPLRSTGEVEKRERGRGKVVK